MSTGPPSSPMPGLGEEPKFTLFSELPKEMRILIWEHALPSPRIVCLQRHVLRSYDTTRVWSDKAIEDVDNQGRPTFFDMPWEDSSDENLSNDDGLDNYWYVRPTHPPLGFRSQSQPPTLIFVCHESLEVVERFYTKSFGDRFSLPTTWFDFEIDTLYLDWGWHDVSGVPFDAVNLGEVASQIKHLAIYNTQDDFQLRGIDGPEEALCENLLEFRSLETLTLVNRRHKPDEKTSDLVFMNLIDLLIWQPFWESNAAEIDMTIFDELIASWPGEKEVDIAWTMGGLPPEPSVSKRAQYPIPPWRMPKITRKIITPAYMRNLLETIAGGPGGVEKLSVLSASWINEISRDPVSAFTSVDFTPAQQRQYMDAIIATFPESLVRSIDEEV